MSVVYRLRQGLPAADDYDSARRAPQQQSLHAAAAIRALSELIEFNADQIKVIKPFRKESRWTQHRTYPGFRGQLLAGDLRVSAISYSWPSESGSVLFIYHGDYFRKRTTRLQWMMRHCQSANLFRNRRQLQLILANEERIAATQSDSLEYELARTTAAVFVALFAAAAITLLFASGGGRGIGLALFIAPLAAFAAGNIAWAAFAKLIPFQNSLLQAYHAEAASERSETHTSTTSTAEEPLTAEA